MDTNTPSILRDIPVWLRPTTLQRWPARPESPAALRCTFARPATWDRTPETATRASEIEHVYQGAQPGELLSVAFMDGADLTADMRDWIEPVVALTGSLLPAPQGGSRELVEWVYLGRDGALTEELGADEVHLYTGVAKVLATGLATGPATAPTLNRLYVVLARKQERAWKLILSLATACLPGMPEAMIEANDHVRAGATLGHLQLHSPA